MRKYYVIKNIFAKWISIAIITILQLIARKIFIQYYSDDLMGLCSLLQSVISMLSLLELGIGSAIYFNLYDPLAKHDDCKIAAIMQLYKRIYSRIGIAVLVVGLCLLPFINIFITTEVELNTVKITYLILLLDTGLSYFMAYRRNIFSADQKEYIGTDVDTITTIGATITQIILTILVHNYYLYIGSKVVWTIGANIFIYIYAGNQYPYIKPKTNYRLSKEFIRKFKNDVKALCVVNIASYLVFGTDNLLISKYVNLSSVFIYSNYNTIINTINKLFHSIFNSAQASVGNYIVIEGKEKSYELFENMFFVNFLITCYTSVSLITVFNNFMELWLGKEYILPIGIVAILIYNNYSRFILQTPSVFRNAAGIYSPYRFYKYWGLIEGVVNLFASLLLIHVLKGQKILGIFLGTSISTVITSIVGSHALFKYYFGIEKLRKYIYDYFLYLFLTIGYSVISLFLCKIFYIENAWINTIIALGIAALIPNIFNVVIFRNSYSMNYFKKLFLKKLENVKGNFLYKN